MAFQMERAHRGPRNCWEAQLVTKGVQQIDSELLCKLLSGPAVDSSVGPSLFYIPTTSAAHVVDMQKRPAALPLSSAWSFLQLAKADLEIHPCQEGLVSGVLFAPLRL